MMTTAMRFLAIQTKTKGHHITKAIATQRREKEEEERREIGNHGCAAAVAIEIKHRTQDVKIVRSHFSSKEICLSNKNNCIMETNTFPTTNRKTHHERTKLKKAMKMRSQMKQMKQTRHKNHLNHAMITVVMKMMTVAMKYKSNKKYSGFFFILTYINLCFHIFLCSTLFIIFFVLI